MRDLVLIAAFKQWLKEKYNWSYDYFCRICGDARQEEIWDDFWKEMEQKKHRS